MAELFLFLTAGQILGKLTTLAIHEIGLTWGVKNDLKKLERTVSSLQFILLDADEKRKQSRHVEDWLEQLQDVLYEIDDLLDDFMTEQLRHNVLIRRSKRKAVINFFSSSNSVALRVWMSHKLQKIRSRLEEIDADSKKFDFIKRDLDGTIAHPVRKETHSYIGAANVIGRHVDKGKIIQVLLSSRSCCNSTDENIFVLPIVGLGGLGKTTLAKLVYNDEAIVSNFKRRLWIWVSEEFDLKKLIEKIMKDATGGVDHSHLELNQLQARLRSTLDSTKFLLVLDDVWNEDQEKWEALKELLSCGSHRSKIIVTTRKKSTAEIMCTSPPYELKGLSDEECMTIFVKRAFKEGEEKQYPKLLEIGKAIVMKCKGLPLAVKSVGSLVYTKREELEWVHIRDSDIWRTSQKDNDVLPILKLSYDEMPLYLKRCFAYCSRFPKDVMLDSSMLTDQWMANGLIHSPSDGGRQRLENIGNQYFLELLSRSFFQIEQTYFSNFTIGVKMHDLVHDLALLVAGKEVLHFKYDTKIVYEGTRYLLFSAVEIKREEFPQFLLKLNKVRSFAFQYGGVHINKRFLNTLLETFQSLRTLTLNGSEFEELPSSIGSLKHLRLLRIEHNKKIKTLPNNICNLVNLQTLNLIGCLMLQHLPRDFGNLWSLRNLRLTCQMKGRFPEKGIAEGLCCLQFLGFFRCFNLESLSVGMQNLTTLRQLYIVECPSLTSLPVESMKHLTSLEELLISKCEKLNLLDEESKTMELPRGLLSLTFCDVPKLKELPHGFEKASASIEYIDIRNCSSFEILPEWLKKCTSLKKLGLQNCSANMKRKCKKQIGEYWPLISHIPQRWIKDNASKSSIRTTRTHLSRSSSSIVLDSGAGPAGCVATLRPPNIRRSVSG